MSSHTPIIGPIGGAIGAMSPLGLIGAVGGAKLGSTAQAMFTPPSTPNLLKPNALSEQPTKAKTASAAAKRNLDEERNRASTGAYLLGGQGATLKPLTTSTTLLGGV